MDNTRAPNSSIGDLIEQFVRDVGSISGDDAEFSRTIELFDNGYLDSLGIVALTAFIEETFAVTLAEDDLFDERFTTIAGMAEIITTRKSITARQRPADTGRTAVEYPSRRTNAS